MANRQVRLDPEICDWVEAHAYDWDCSLSRATNDLLRALKDGPVEKEPEAVLPSTPVGATAGLAGARAPRLPKGSNPRLAAILRGNAGR